ncbi:hypothetical protein [Nostoc sp.]|uniref:hypothetical protein n=1 Tax=Nostoc sp. TaxID=1180 RepID=UPI002FFBE406
MSNINNHGVSMNNIELSPHLQELTCEQAAAIQGGAKIQLFLGANFTGKSLLLTINKAGLSKKLTGQFNNSISSAKVLSGRWVLNTNGDGSGLFVEIGPRKAQYPRFEKVLNNTISFAKATVA